MFNRVYFPLIVLFWMVMNALLWRAEFGGGKELGGLVSAGVVWQKILTAPDDSTLEIRWKGRKIGYCRWAANVGEELAGGKVAGEDDFPEGMVRRLAGYTIDLEGNALFGEPLKNTRFKLQLRFATNRVWRELSLRVASRPNVWEIHTVAAKETLEFKYQDAGIQWSNVFTYDELRDPRKLMEEFTGPLPLMLAGTMNGLEQAGNNLSLGLQWEARNDWLKIGHSPVRVYQLRARLFDQYEMVVLVSRVGELMRVELPGSLVLVNENLTAL